MKLNGESCNHQESESFGPWNEKIDFRGPSSALGSLIAIGPVKMVTQVTSLITRDSLCTNPRIHAEVMADEQSVALMTKAIMQQLD